MPATARPPGPLPGAGIRLETLRASLRSSSEGFRREQHPLLLLGQPAVDLSELADRVPIAVEGPQERLSDALDLELRRRAVSDPTRRALVAEIGHLGRAVSAAALAREVAVEIGSGRNSKVASDLPAGSSPTLLIAQQLAHPQGRPRDSYLRTLRTPGRARAEPGAPSLVAWGRASDVEAQLRRFRPSLEQTGSGHTTVIRARLSPEASRKPKPEAAFASFASSEAGSSQPVILVSAPFAPAEYPSLGLSLLRESLAGRPPIAYLTISFAERIGAPLYRWITGGRPEFPALLGEWIFSRAGGLAPPHDSYLEEVACRRTVAWLENGSEPGELMPAALIGEIDHVIEEARSCLDEWCERILALEPRIVGFTSTFQQNAASLALACKLKERRPALTVIFGGSNWEDEMGLAQLESFPFVDVSVSGEADAIFAELIRRILDGGGDLTGLPGVRASASSRFGALSNPGRGTTVDLDELPYPCFDDFFAQWGRSTISDTLEPKLLVESSRGCWWGEKSHCTFCGLNGSSMTFRSKGAQRALDEIRYLVERYPGVELATVDNILDMRYFSTLIEELARDPIGVTLFYEVKANLTKSQVERLKRAGITNIQPGIESLSDHVLQLMRKGVSALQNLQLLKWCTELGIVAYWNLIWGFPGERAEDYEKMLELLPLVAHLSPPFGFGPIRLDRFSPNHSDAERLGLTRVKATRAYSSLYDAPAEQLDRIAYYFDHDYREPREDALHRAIDRLRSELESWRLDYEVSRLVHVPAADGWLVFDSRPCAVEPVHHLDGAAAEVFARCDTVRSLSALAKELGGRDRCLAAVAELAERKLLLEMDGRLLTLSLRAETLAREQDREPADRLGERETTEPKEMRA